MQFTSVRVEVEGRPPREDESLYANTFWVSPDYFDVMEMELREGRRFTEADGPDSGLVHILTGASEPESVYLTTGISNLTLCPSGPHPPNPSELLASTRMAGLLERAQRDFDVVVVDTPPALVVTDAVVLGALCDGMVLCLRANKTLREDAVDCADRLRMGDIRLLGAVLNRFRPMSGDTYSRRYYSYEAYSDSTDEARDSAA